jgi:MFS family permease
MFVSLRIRDYRLLFWGQGLSVCGTWMQTVAQGWLVLELSNSGTVLGIIGSARYVPILLLGPLGGVAADRFDKRRVLLVTQAVSGALAAALAVIVWTRQDRLWLIGTIALTLGVVNAFDQPARLSMVTELVPDRLVANAVTLNSLTQNVGRVVGPAMAGLMITAFGLVACFAANAVSFVAVIAGLLLMDGRRDGAARGRAARAPGQLREGLRYVRHTPRIAIPLLMVTVVGALAWEFPISLPLMARGAFGGGAGTYGAMMAAMGVGAVIGGLIGAARSRVMPVSLARSSLVWGLTILLAAGAPNLDLELGALVLVGYSSVSFNSLAKTLLQLAAVPAMRGRVMSIWNMAWTGSTPLGGPLVGAVGEVAGARWALLVGSIAALVAGLTAYRRLAAEPDSSPVSQEPDA